LDPPLKSHQEYKKEKGEPFLKGVFITHIHADHFQHISFLDPEIPIFCSRITKCLIEATYELSMPRGPESETFKREKKPLDEFQSVYFPSSLTIESGDE